MATKVNTKFVVLLSAGVIVVAGAVAAIGYRTISKTAGDHMALGDQAMSKGDFEGAVQSYAKAVNKARGNPEIIGKWFDALTKITPSPSTVYRERFRSEYMLALNALARNKPDDAAIQNRVLEMMLVELRLVPPTASAWEGLYTAADTAIKNFSTGDANADLVKRYRGIARVTLMQISADQADDKMAEAKSDLEAAVKSNPDDAEATSYLAEWHKAMADRARRRNDLEVADKLTADARKLLVDFTEDKPVWSTAGLALARLDFSESIRKAATTARPVDIMTAQHPNLLRVTEQLLKEPAEKVERQTAIGLAELLVGMNVPDAPKLAVRVLEHRLKGTPTDVVSFFKLGEIELATRQFESALKRLGELSTMKDLPLSQEGVMLFALREEAIARQAEGSLAKWQMTDASKTDERAKLLDEAKAFAAKHAELAGNETTRGMSLRGKIKYAEGDLVEARRLLDSYLEQTGRSDLASLKLLADILKRQGNSGGARQQYERVLTFNQRDMEALGALAQIEIELQDYTKAQKRVDQILAIDPENKAAQEVSAKLIDLLRGTDATDPFNRMQALVQQRMNASPPDMAGALAALREGADKLDLNLPQMISVANRLALFDDLAKAREVLQKAQQKFPEDSRPKDILAALDDPDPLPRQLRQIEAAELPDLVKHMLRFQLFTRLGKTAEADDAFSKAKALDAEHPLVVSTLFDKALAAKDMNEANRLAGLAVTKNLDKVNGLIFRVRFEQAQGRLAEAEQLAQQAVDKDPLNPTIWRLLGLIRIQREKPGEAGLAFERGLALKPDDIELIKGAIRAKVAAGQNVEALAQARGALQYAQGDTDFATLWLSLEGAVGDKARAIELRQRQFNRDPKDCENAMELANLLIQDGKFPDARRALDAVKANCSTAATTTTRVVLEASWFGNQRDVVGAKKVWEDYIASLPSEQREPELYIAYAQFMSRLGQNGTAMEILKGARGTQDAKLCQIDREISDLYFAANDFKSAIPEYERVLKDCQDDDMKVRFRLVEAYIRGGEAKKADELALQMEKLGTMRPEDKPTFYLLRADAATALGDRPKAKEHYDNALSANPNLAIAFVKRAEFRLGDPDLVADGISDLERALQLDKRFSAARARLAQHYLQTDQRERGISLLREGLDVNPDDTGIRVELVRQLNRIGRPGDALQTVQDIMQRSADPQWKTMAGELLAQGGQHEDAVKLFAEAWKVSRNPGLARLYSESLLVLPRPDVARVRELLNDPATGANRFAPLMMLKARVAALEGRTEDVKNEVVAAFRGLELTSLSETTQFFSDLKKAMPKAAEVVALLDPLKPKDTPWPEATGVHLARLRLTEPGLRAEGLAMYDAMLASPQDKTTVMQGVRVSADGLYADKQYEAATELYKRLLVQLPDDANLLNNLAYTYSKHLDRHQEALPLAKQAASAQPNNPNVLDTLGTVQLALGQLADAEQTLRRGMEVANTPEQQLPIVLHLTEVALAKGDRAGADGFLLQADRILGRDPRIRVRFDSEITRVQKKLRGEN